MSKNRLLLRKQNIVTEEPVNTVFNNSIAYYKLDGTTAGVAIDEVNGNNGIINGTITQGVTGKINQAIQSDGSSGSYLEIPITAWNENQFYHSGWFYYDSVAGQYLKITSRGNSGFGFTLEINNLVALTYSNIIAFTSVNSDAINNAWNHYIIEKNGDTTKIYVNNVLKFNQTGNYGTSGDSLIIGGVSNNTTGGPIGGENPFLIDELDFRNTPYTQEERDYLYNSGAGGEYVAPPLQPFANSDSYYKLDGTTAGVAIDEVNGNDGFITAGITQGVTGKINQAFQSDGVGTEYLRIPKTAYDENNFYHSAWFYYSSTGGQRFFIVCRNNNNGTLQNGGGFLLNITDQIEFVFLGVLELAPVNSDVIDNAWNHVIIEKPGGTIRIYINNVLKLNTTESYEFADAIVHYGVITEINGTVRTDSSNPFIIDELDFRSVPYTQKERDYLYNSGAGGEYVAPPLFTNAEGYFTLDETSGNFTDLINNYAGIPVGGVTQGVVGKINNAADLDGVDDYIDFGNDDLFKFTDGTNDIPFTIRFWVNFDVVDVSQAFFVKWRFEAENQQMILQYDIANNGFMMYVSGSKNVIWTYTPTVNTWYHMALTYDGSKALNGFKLYLNGVELTNRTNSATTFGGFPSNPTVPLVFGYRTDITDNYFDGTVDEITIIKNDVWSPSQITEDYNAGAGNTYTQSTITPALPPTATYEPLLQLGDAYYKLNETTGNVIDSITGFDGSAFGGVTRGIAGRVNNAFSFDGSTGYLNFGNNPLSEFTDGAGNDIPFTFKCWVNFDRLDTGHTLLDKWGEYLRGNSILWEYLDVDNAFKITLSNGFKPVSASSSYMEITFPWTTEIAGVWKHLVLTYDGTKSSSGVKMYIDGIEISQSSTAQTFNGFVESTQPLVFGVNLDELGFTNTFQNYFEGKADEIAIVKNRVWSQTQIDYDYNNGNGFETILKSPRMSPLFENATMYWNFDNTPVDDETNSSESYDLVNGFEADIRPSGDLLSPSILGNSVELTGGFADWDIEFRFGTLGNQDLAYNYTDSNGDDIPYTIRYWIYNNTDPNQQIISPQGKANLLGQWDYNVQYKYMKIFGEDVNMPDTPLYFPNAELPIGEWKHLVLRYDGSEISDGVKLYIDGVEIPQHASTLGQPVKGSNIFKYATFPGSSTTFTKMRYGGTPNLQGRFDEFTIIRNEAWSETKIGFDYNNGVGRTYFIPPSQ